MGKLAFVLPNWATLSRDELIFYSKLGEQLGYDTVWVPETWGNDAFTIMNTILENTKKINVATGIIRYSAGVPPILHKPLPRLTRSPADVHCLGLARAQML